MQPHEEETDGDGIRSPALPGKREALRALTSALGGERRAEFDRAQVSVTHESWFLQSTPEGDFVVIYFEAPDPAVVVEALAASREPFDVWYKERLQGITGIDLNQPPPFVPERILHWSRP